MLPTGHGSREPPAGDVLATLTVVSPRKERDDAGDVLATLTVVI